MIHHCTTANSSLRIKRSLSLRVFLMLRRICCSTVPFLLLMGFGLAAVRGAMPADDRTGADLVPASAVFYAEMTRVSDDITTILNHPIAERVVEHAGWAKVEESQPWKNFVAGRTFFELQMGGPWNNIVDGLTGGGVYVTYDLRTDGLVILVKATSPEAMEVFRSKVLELSRLGKNVDPDEDTYRDLQIYRLENAAAVVSGQWLMIANKAELGRFVIDRMLDTQGEKSDVLSASANFRTAVAGRQDDLSAWAWASLDSLRENEKFLQGLNNKSENPLAELLAGGLQSNLLHAPYATAEVRLPETGVEFSVAMPASAEWIPESRQWYFGPELGGMAPGLPEVPDTLLALGTWRDVSEMWLRAGDLFDEKMNDELANADSTLTTLFAGKDFGEDILGSFEPQMGIIVTRQSFENVLPAPAIRLPAFAFVMELRDPETMTRELRRTFQNMIGFFNVVGAMEGRPQLEMDIDKFENGEMLTSAYVPEDDVAESTTADLIFNFSPSIGFSGKRCVIASTRSLASALTQSRTTAAPVGQVNSYAAFSAPVLRQVLDDNREQLISQNMLEQGNSRGAAEDQISLLLEVIACFRDVDFTMGHSEGMLQIEGKIHVEQDFGLKPQEE